jgi:hypothetical protein
MYKHGRLHAVHTERSLVALVFLGIGLVVASGIGKFISYLHVRFHGAASHCVFAVKKLAFAS